MRSTGFIYLIHSDPPNPGKKISRCNHDTDELQDSQSNSEADLDEIEDLNIG